MKTIHAASEAIKQGRLSPVELLEGCLARIEQLESKVRAWVLVDRKRALAEAEARAKELQRGQWRGPLHGIPLGIKDIFDVFDWPTAAGSRLWEKSIARHDATVVKRLRQAGAVLMGKTVTTPYASFDPPPTRNPWDLGRTPGGSSSGSAAALACGMCLGALGSQTGGSLTRPATYCGVTTCKPTWGRVSTHGVLALAPSMDHVGPMGRCVRDLALLLQVIAGPDPLDLACHPDHPDDCVQALATTFTGGRKPRLGRLRGLFESRAEPIMREVLDRVCGQLAAAGASIVEVPLPAAFAEVLARHRVVMAVEAAAYHEERLRRHPEDYPPCITSLLEEGLACPALEYARTKEHQQMLRIAMGACLQNVDALLCPATTGPAPAADTTGDPAFNSPWSYVGLPTVALPAALSPERLPVGIQLVGRAFGEGQLLAAAAWCEKVLQWPLADVEVSAG